MTPAARVVSAIVGVALAMLLGACGPTASATTQTASPTVPAPTVPVPTVQITSPATATPLGANPCGSSSSAESARLLNAWRIPTPAGAIVVDQGAQASDGPDGGVQYELTGVCAKESSPDNVWAFYRARMPAAGWTQSATIPTVGGSSAPCGYKYCWTRDAGNGVMVVVTLTNMQVKGSNTEFTIVYQM